jgi:membrane-associated protein
VGGVAAMNYKVFFKYNIIGAILWVLSLCLAGYFLGSIPLVRDNFEKVVLGIVAFSVLPILWQLVKAKLYSRGSKVTV